MPRPKGYGIRQEENMTRDQKTRQEELEAKDTLTAEETEELKILAALPQEVEEDSPEAEFDSAWDELDNPLSADEAKAKAEKEAEEKAKEEAEEAAKEKSQSTESTKTDGDILNSTPVDSDTKPDSTNTDANADPRDEKITELEHKMSSWEGRLKAADKRAAEAERKLKEAEAKGQSKESDKASPDEDDAQLSAFFNEFPDLEGPIKKVAEKIATTIVNDKMSKLDTIEANQTRLQESAEEEANQVHMDKINTAHPDWEHIYDSGALETWIKRQPGYLQPRLYEILRDGSAREVIDMFDSYKRAAGKGKETSTNSATSPEKQAKAKAMEAVPASTAGPKKGAMKIAKDDFDGAWDELEKKESKK
jgi:hypothetical protein